MYTVLEFCRHSNRLMRIRRTLRGGTVFGDMQHQIFYLHPRLIETFRKFHIHWDREEVRACLRRPQTFLRIGARGLRGKGPSR